MPQPPNKALRLLVPAVVLALGLGVVYLVFKAWTPKPATPTPNQTPAAAQPGASAPAPAPTPAPVPSVPAPQPAPGAVVLNGPLKAKVFAGAKEPTTIGSTDPVSARMLLEFSRVGIGVRAATLSDQFVTIRREQHEVVQHERSVTGSDGSATILAPFAALSLEVTPAGGQAQRVLMFADPAGAVWNPIDSASGAFEAYVVDAAGHDVLRIERHYELSASTPTVLLHQTITNLSDTALSVRWSQIGLVDMDPDEAGYGGDKRRVRFGYLLSAEKDPSRSVVVSDGHALNRADALGKRNAAGGYDESVLWPTKAIEDEKLSLSWVGVTNRYFGAAVAPLHASAGQGSKTLDWVERVTRVVLDAGSGAETVALRLDSRPLALSGKGSSADVSLAAYMGAVDRAMIGREPLLQGLGVEGLILYNFGGMCGFCTFAWIAEALYFVLHKLHDWVFRDWALSIIFLVVVVRSCLHPITRWSQIRTARFSKQMQAVGPKQKLLQEKYREDPVKLQAETRKLWAEEGISPAGFLGCLPMFLQTPVWIALYATLFFAFELRHQHAFYGVFQAIQGATSPCWWFLGDLSQPDRFWYFAKSADQAIHIPLLSGMVGPVSSLNILPLILGVVFFIQQKYLAQPTAQAQTPEQEFQMKMMKWMTVVMFPLFMYNAPSGLALYFIANSTLGILESKWIRAHMEKHGMLDLDRMREERQRRRGGGGGGAGPTRGRGGGGGPPPGWFAKLQAWAEERQNAAKRYSQGSKKQR